MAFVEHVVAEGRLAAEGAGLSAGQFSQLIQGCRAAKERLLEPAAPESVKVTVLGAGSRLVAGDLRALYTMWLCAAFDDQSVEPDVVEELMPLLPAEERRDIQRLSAYPEGTAGSAGGTAPGAGNGGASTTTSASAASASAGAG